MACLDCLGCANKFPVENTPSQCSMDHCANCGQDLYEPVMKCFVNKNTAPTWKEELLKIAELYLSTRRLDLDPELATIHDRLARALENQDHLAIEALLEEPETLR